MRRINNINDIVGIRTVMPDQWPQMPQPKPNHNVSVRPGDWPIYNGQIDMEELNRIHRNRMKLDVVVVSVATLILITLTILFV